MRKKDGRKVSVGGRRLAGAIVLRVRTAPVRTRLAPVWAVALLHKGPTDGQEGANGLHSWPAQLAAATMGLRMEGTVRSA